MRLVRLWGRTNRKSSSQSSSSPPRTQSNNKNAQPREIGSANNDGPGEGALRR